MIESSLQAWVLFLGLVLLASFAGLAVSSRFPWNDIARQVHIDRATGIALGPFLAGMSTVVVLYLMPGAAHATHASSVFALLGLLAVSYFVKRPRTLGQVDQEAQPALAGYLLALLLVAWCVLLLVNSIFIPLIQNDSLEYALVGREIFLARSLSVYPLINPESSTSGFFAPWTHPPLYVSMIYLASVLQGHANEPGLMRLISPWFLMSATYAVVTMGRMRSSNTGLLTGILFISIPLLFLGADSALIDALPVSGMVLIMLVMVGAQRRFPAYPLTLGALMGLGLWTHSQSILFIPLVIVVFIAQQGLSHWRLATKKVLVTLVVGLIVGCMPYVRNILIFGSPISDNPLVFALPELDWSGYFRYSRGIDHWVAIVQYGVFKGWFSLEAYGWLFWAWAAGCILFILQQGRKRLAGIFRLGIDGEDGHLAPLWLGFILVVTYLSGVVASVAMGIDLMIRNERYMLIMAPPLALGGAFFIEVVAQGLWCRLYAFSGRASVKDAYLAMYWIFTALFLLHAVSVGWYYRWRYVEAKPKHTPFSEELSVEQGRDSFRFDWLLNYWPSIKLVKELQERIPEDALVLSMRPADMYYSRRKMVSYLDPRLIPFYREGSPEKAATMLKALGIRYVFMTDYSLPPVYDSTLATILADPRLSRLVYSHGMFQLYALEESEQTVGERIDLTPGVRPWTKTPQIRIGGRKALEAAGHNPSLFEGGESNSLNPFFHRDYSIILASGQGESLNGGRHKTFMPVEPGEYVVRMELKGQGFVTLWLVQFDANGVAVTQQSVDRNRPMRIGDLSLSENNPQIAYARRFRIDPRSRYIRIGVEHVGRSRVTVDQMTLERLEPVDRQNVSAHVD